MSGTSLGRLYVDLLAKTSGFETDMGRAAWVAEKRAQEIDRAVSRMGDRVVGGFKVAALSALSFTGAALSVQSAVGAIGEAIRNADRVDELSTRLGIGAEKLSAWGFAAKQAGSDLESVGAAVPKLSKQIAAAADPTSSASKLFAALGIDAKDAEGRLRDVEDVLPEVADRFKALNDDTLEQTLAMELFGKSGAELLEFLNSYSDLMADVPENAIISAETAQRAAEFGDQVDRLKAVMSGLSAEVSAELLPQLNELVAQVSEFVNDGQNAELIANAISVAFNAASQNAEIFRVALGGLSEAGLGAIGVLAQLAESVAGRDVAGEAAALASIEGLSAREISRNGQKRPSFAGVYTRVSSSEKAFSLEDNVRKLFSGSGRKGRSGDSALSEEQRAAEQLAKAYDGLISRQDERLAQLAAELETGGKLGEAWRVAYDVQNGALQNLEPWQKLQALINAETEDQLALQVELRGKQADDAERFDEYLADLDREHEALGLSNLELRVRNAQMAAGIKLNTEQAAAIEAKILAMDKTERIVGALDGVRDITEELFYNLPNGAADAWKNALDSIEAMLLQWAAKGIINQLFGEAGTTGGGSLFGDVLGGLFGGGEGNGFGGIFASVFGGGRAIGGPVTGGKLYEVTERGLPELLSIGDRQLLMMPAGRAGMVTPMAPARGGRGVTTINNFHLGAPTERRTQDQIAAKTGFMADRALRRNS